MRRTALMRLWHLHKATYSALIKPVGSIKPRNQSEHDHGATKMKRKRDGSSLLTGKAGKAKNIIKGRKAAIKKAVSGKTKKAKVKAVKSKIRQSDKTAKTPKNMQKSKAEGRAELAKLRAKQRARAKAKAKEK